MHEIKFTDVLTHAIFGASVYAAAKGVGTTRKDLFWGMSLGMMVDADVFIGLGMDSVQALVNHRCWSHSVLFTCFAAWVVGLVRKRWGQNTINWRDGLAIFLAIHTHIWLDALTTYGTGIVFPFSSRPIAWNVIHVFHPAATLTLLAPWLWSDDQVGAFRSRLTHARCVAFNFRARRRLLCTARNQTGSAQMQKTNGKVVVCLFMSVLLMFVWASCNKEPQPEGRTALEHAYECEEAFGPLPRFSCGDAIPVPVTKDGVPRTSGSFNPNKCDCPTAFGKACDLTYRVGRYTGLNEDGTPNEDVVFLTNCRDGGLGVIGHKFSTGETCFLHINLYTTGAYDLDIPRPGEEGYNDCWQWPNVVAHGNCQNCHMASAFHTRPQWTKFGIRMTPPN